MALKSRYEALSNTDNVELKVQFQDMDGQIIDLDALPTITLIQPSGNVVIGPTSTGVYQIGTGLYGFEYHIPYHTTLGVWKDYWRGFYLGIPVENTFSFIIHNTQLPQINSDGYEALGDDVGFDYSQEAIHNINKLLKSLRARLKSRGKSKAKDKYGNDIYTDCDIYNTEELISFLATALWKFNSIPHYTFFTFDHTGIIDQFGEAIVQTAHFMALAAQALIEKGTEFTINDNGISHNPAQVSDLLNSQYGTELSHCFDQLKLIKHNMKPFPLGLGTLTSTTLGRNNYISRVRRSRVF